MSLFQVQVRTCLAGLNPTGCSPAFFFLASLLERQLILGRLGVLLFSTISNTETCHITHPVLHWTWVQRSAHDNQIICLPTLPLLLLVYPPGHLFSTANSPFSITVIKNRYIYFFQDWRSVLLLMTTILLLITNICQYASSDCKHLSFHRAWLCLGEVVE